MSEPRWMRVAAVDELTPGDVKEVRVLARVVAVFNIDGRLWAIDGLCRHMSAKLTMGKLEGTKLTCPRHEWQYDITDGRCLTAGQEWAKLRTYELRVDDDIVYVNVAPIYASVAAKDVR